MCLEVSDNAYRCGVDVGGVDGLICDDKVLVVGLDVL